MTEDERTTIRASPDGFDTLAALKSQGFFETELAAFLATASLAIALNLEPKDMPSGSRTKWNRGSGDIDRWLRLAPHLVETEDATKTLECYGEAGLAHVQERMTHGEGFADIYLASRPEES